MQDGGISSAVSGWWTTFSGSPIFIKSYQDYRKVVCYPDLSAQYLYLSVCDKTTMVNHVHKSKSPSKSAKCQMSRTKLSTHHSYDSSFVLVGAESQKRELRKRREEEEGKRKSHFCTTCEPLIRIHCYSLWQWRWWCFFIVVKDTFVSKGIKERPSHQFAMLAFCLRWRITIQVPSK